MIIGSVSVELWAPLVKGINMLPKSWIEKFLLKICPISWVFRVKILEFLEKFLWVVFRPWLFGQMPTKLYYMHSILHSCNVTLQPWQFPSPSIGLAAAACLFSVPWFHGDLYNQPPSSATPSKYSPNPSVILKFYHFAPALNKIQKKVEDEDYIPRRARVPSTTSRFSI